MRSSRCKQSAIVSITASILVIACWLLGDAAMAVACRLVVAGSKSGGHICLL